MFSTSQINGFVQTYYNVLNKKVTIGLHRALEISFCLRILSFTITKLFIMFNGNNVSLYS